MKTNNRPKITINFLPFEVRYENLSTQQAIKIEELFKSHPEIFPVAESEGEINHFEFGFCSCDELMDKIYKKGKKVINIHIDNLIGEMHIRKDIDPEKLKQKITEILLSAVNNAEII